MGPYRPIGSRRVSKYWQAAGKRVEVQGLARLLEKKNVVRGAWRVVDAGLGLRMGVSPFAMAFFVVFGGDDMRHARIRIPKYKRLCSDPVGSMLSSR